MGLEEHLFKRALHDNLHTTALAENSLWLHGRAIRFYSDRYVALELWNVLFLKALPFGE